MLSIRNLLLSLGVAGIASQGVVSASELTDSLYYSVELSGSVSSGDYTPFWLVSNRQGLSSTKKDNGYLRAAIIKTMDENKRFSYGFGADLAVAANYTSTFIIQQLYGEVRYRKFALTVGSKERHDRFNNERLSSGDLLFSGNARPVPEIKISVDKYLMIPWINRWAGVKGYLSFGRFTDDNWQTDFVNPDANHSRKVLFHSKGGFLKVGDETRFPLTAEAGFEMAAQFGGEAYVNGEWIKMPQSFKDFWKVMFTQGGGTDAPVEDQTNIYGNHVGEWSAQIKWDTPEWGAKVYFEHYFEDQSMLFWDFGWRDFLLGVEGRLPENRFVSHVVYEYLNTKFQSSSVYWDHTPEIPEQVSGRDDYYNHGIYSGWQHWGMGIGNPLIISPIYNTDGVIRFKNNRVKGHHFGIDGQPFPRISYRLLGSFTRGWGTYMVPYEEVKHNTNMMLEVGYLAPWLNNIQITGAFAFDHGDLIGNNYGFMLTLRKTGLF